MNSKCRKSNLVPHWYTLLFAYLPAPVVSIRTWHLKYTTAHVFPPFFPSRTVSFLPSSFPLSPTHSCPSPLFGYSSPPPRHLTHPLSHSDIRVLGFFFPPHGRMHDRGAGGTGSKWQIPPSPTTTHPSTSPSKPLSCQRSRFLTSSSGTFPILSWPHWYSNRPIPSYLSTKVSPNHRGGRQ